MAKRIKVSGKPPRGLSKAQRMRKGLEQEFDSGYRKHYNKPSVSEPHVSEVLRPEDVLRDNPRFKGGVSRPSSTRKKRVKEGSRKFIGPRQLKSELAEDSDARRLEMITERMEELGLPKDIEEARSSALFTKFLGSNNRPIRQSLRGKEARKRRGSEIEEDEQVSAMSPNLRRRLYEFLSRKASRG